MSDIFDTIASQSKTKNSGDIFEKISKTANPSVATEGWEFLENHPFKSLLQPASQTAIGKTPMQMAEESTPITEPPIRKQGRTVIGPTEADMMPQLSRRVGAIQEALLPEAFSAPANLIPAGKLGEAVAPKLIKALKEGAEKSYTKALGPTTKAEKELAQKVTPSLVGKKTIFRTRQGLLDKATQNVEKYGLDIDTELKNIPKQTRVNIEPILEKIKGFQNGLTINKTVPEINKPLFDSLKKIKLDFINTMKSMKARPEFVRQYRQALDKIISRSSRGFGMDITGKTVLDSQNIMANSIRGELASKFPNIARLNKEFSLWKNIQDLLETTAPKTKSPLSAFHAFGAEHAVSHGAPFIGIFVNLSKLVSDNVLWNSISGSMKANLAESMSRGDFRQAGRLLDAMKITAVSKSQQPIYKRDINPTLRGNGLFKE